MRKFLSLLLFLALFSCQSEPRSKGPFQGLVLLTPSGEAIETRVVYTMADQTLGLSGIRPENFADSEGMLFFYMDDSEKSFWMPDTYFDLDLIYLDRQLRIIDIIRKLPHYIGRNNEDLIPRARGVYCRHTLEMKASSFISAKLKIGDQLKWKGNTPLTEAERIISKELGTPVL
jgi:uncharacterized membrane protein (UPF0127 family)